MISVLSGLQQNNFQLFCYGLERTTRPVIIEIIVRQKSSKIVPEALVYAFRHGHSPNERDLAGLTPLYYVQSVELCNLLLRHRACVNEVNLRNHTPLVHHVSKRRYDIARLLFPRTTICSWHNSHYREIATEFAAAITMCLLKRRGIYKDVRVQIGKYILAEGGF